MSAMSHDDWLVDEPPFEDGYLDWKNRAEKAEAELAEYKAKTMLVDAASIANTREVEAELARYKAALAYAMNHHSRDMDYFNHVMQILAADELYGAGLEPDQTEEIRKNQEMRARLDQLPLAAGPAPEGEQK